MFIFIYGFKILYPSYSIESDANHIWLGCCVCVSSVLVTPWTKPVK